MSYSQQKVGRAMIALLVVVASAHIFAGRSLAAETTVQDRVDFNQRIGPILEKYCYDCHGRKQTKGKVKLTEYASWLDLEKNPQLIEKMIEALGRNEMPPEEKKQPSDPQRKFMLLELGKALKNATANSRSVI
ncbi:MAG: c-type cytochrome domain-containing protein, partial [Planctomycetota bacterium]|nr:c-type cytochrome domain-containing protein [Planctomycetota bacterium]